MKFYWQQPGVYCMNKGWKFIEEAIPAYPQTRSHIDIYGYAKGGGSIRTCLCLV